MRPPGKASVSEENGAGLVSLLLSREEQDPVARSKAQRIMVSHGPGFNPLEWRVDEQKSLSSQIILLLEKPGTAVEVGGVVSMMKLLGWAKLGWADPSPE